MRTSRISRETAHVTNTLSSPLTGRRTRRSARLASDDTPTSTLENASAASDVDSATSSTLGKRKRAQPSDPSTRKPRRQPAKHINGPNGTYTVTPPTNWERVYATCAAMRKRLLAPVDTMGCETLAQPDVSPRDQRLQTLVALMLSSQTKDTVTAAAISNLQQNLPGGLNLESLLAVEPEELNRLIAKVGFHNNKTAYIKKTALLLQSTFASDIPNTIEGLTSLPGVGPKMAYLCMSGAWGRDEGIGVDVHVHRITNLWGWHKTSTPEQTRLELEAWLPRDKWHEINTLLVGLGQTVCLPVGRRCGECDLSAEGLCPGAVRGAGGKKRVVKKEVEVEGQVEEVKVEVDDVGVKVEADLEDEGKIEIQGLVGQEPELLAETG